MTVSPSLSGIEDHATSSILDSSNYTIQAISFGTGSEAFRNNAHKYEGSLKIASLSVVAAAFASDPPLVGVVGLLFEPSSLIPSVWSDPKGSYFPVAGLPIAPTPTLSVLEENTNNNATDVSSVFPGNGQLTNFMPSGIFSAMMENTIFSATVEAYTVASLLGCFADGSSVPYFGNKGYISAYATNDDGSVGVEEFETINGNTTFNNGSFFNEVSSMDVSGFVNMVMSGSPGTTTDYEMSSGASGLCVSGGHQGESAAKYASPFGTVEYTVMISADDMNFANAYGGIYHLGLWTIDMSRSLLNGNTPPFAFSVLNNPRKYKLFARKGLSVNLCYINNNGSTKGALKYTDLTLKWRLHFL